MLDVVDFIEERGGDPKKIRESQRRRFAPEEAVDEVIALFEDHRKSKFWPRLLFVEERLRGVPCSKIRSFPNRHEDQCDPEGDWFEEACQSNPGRKQAGLD